MDVRQELEEYLHLNGLGDCVEVAAPPQPDGKPAMWLFFDANEDHSEYLFRAKTDAAARAYASGLAIGALLGVQMATKAVCDGLEGLEGLV